MTYPRTASRATTSA